MTTAHLQKYRDMKFQSADAPELLLLTYDGALKSLRKARRLGAKGELSRAQAELMTCMAAVIELDNTLRKDVEPIGPALHQLYLYVIRLLSKALIDLAPAPLSEAEGLLAELQTTWQQALRGAQ